MSSLIINIEEFNSVLEYSINAEIKITYDESRENYGADADGRRGVMTTMYELIDATPLDVTAWETDQDGNEKQHLLTEAEATIVAYELLEYIDNNFVEEIERNT